MCGTVPLRISSRRGCACFCSAGNGCSALRSPNSTKMASYIYGRSNIHWAKAERHLRRLDSNSQIQRHCLHYSSIDVVFAAPPRNRRAVVGKHDLLCFKNPDPRSERRPTASGPKGSNSGQSLFPRRFCAVHYMLAMSLDPTSQYFELTMRFEHIFQELRERVQADRCAMEATAGVFILCSQLLQLFLSKASIFKYVLGECAANHQAFFLTVY